MTNLALYLSSAVVLLISSTFTIYKALDADFFSRFYAFDLDSITSLCLTSIQQHGENDKALVNAVVDGLRANSGIASYINPHEEWVLNNAGGAMGAVWIVHASNNSPPIQIYLYNANRHAGITEYIIIFATAVGTEGHTGRLTADDYFHILSGTQLAFTAGSYEAEVYGPGSVHHLKRGQAKQMKMPGPCFALGYARGWIPGLMMFGYADGLFSTMDYRTLWDTSRITARQVVGNLLKGKI